VMAELLVSMAAPNFRDCIYIGQNGKTFADDRVFGGRSGAATTAGAPTVAAMTGIRWRTRGDFDPTLPRNGGRRLYT
jgi:hypothetical protein